MPKLNQILAIVKGEKEKSNRDLTNAHHGLQKKELISGISKTYRPRDAEGEVYPDESTQVQIRAHRVVDQTDEILSRLWNTVAIRDWTNCKAKADIVLNPGTDDAEVLIEGVPVTYLLWMEKQLDDMYTFVSKLPTLPSDEVWEFDPGQDCYRSPSFESAKMKKITRPLVKYEATKEHPAQVDLVTEDQVIGYWTTTKYSGALPATRVEELKTRVKSLQRAVKFARENANSVDAEQPEVASKIFRFLFGG